MRCLREFKVTTELIYPLGTQTYSHWIKTEEVGKRPEEGTREKR